MATQSPRTRLDRIPYVRHVRAGLATAALAAGVVAVVPHRTHAAGNPVPPPHNPTAPQVAGTYGTRARVGAPPWWRGRPRGPPFSRRVWRIHFTGAHNGGIRRTVANTQHPQSWFAAGPYARAAATLRAGPAAPLHRASVGRRCPRPTALCPSVLSLTSHTPNTPRRNNACRYGRAATSDEGRPHPPTTPPRVPCPPTTTAWHPVPSCSPSP